jgi:hypothetical protein
MIPAVYRLISSVEASVTHWRLADGHWKRCANRRNMGFIYFLIIKSIRIPANCLVAENVSSPTHDGCNVLA